MGDNRELRIGKLQEDRVYTLIVNKYNDTIDLPLDDANFVGRFTELLHWLENYEKEAREKEKEISERFKGHEVVSQDEEGNSIIDMDYLDELVGLNTSIYRAISEKIEGIFGKDSLKKYFRAQYERTPDFIPDEDALGDFLEEISQVINVLYDTKVEYKRKRKARFSKYQKVYHK